MECLNAHIEEKQAMIRYPDRIDDYFYNRCLEFTGKRIFGEKVLDLNKN